MDKNLVFLLAICLCAPTSKHNTLITVWPYLSPAKVSQIKLTVPRCNIKTCV